MRAKEIFFSTLRRSCVVKRSYGISPSESFQKLQKLDDLLISKKQMVCDLELKREYNFYPSAFTFALHLRPTYAEDMENQFDKAANDYIENIKKKGRK